MDSIIGTVVQGGAVGLAALSLWIIYKLTTYHYKHLSNILEQNQKVLERNTDAWNANTQATQRLSDRIDDMMKQN